MELQSADNVTKVPAAARRNLFGTVVVLALAVAFVGASIGFVGFLSQLRGAEAKPARSADGIVVLTGGSSDRKSVV